MRHHFLLVIPVFMLLATACRAPQGCVAPDNYAQQLSDWRDTRMAELLAPTGWVALVGLYWLDPGPNTAGSAAGHQLEFPAEAPDQLGVFHVSADSVWAEFPAEAGVTADGRPCTRASLTGPNAAQVFRQGPFQWVLLERGGRYGIRVWDTLIPTRIRMRPIPHFPDNPAWLVSAHFTASPRPDTVLMRNVLGMDLPTPVLGRLEFVLQGQRGQLLALDGGPNDLFLIFSDETTGQSTYSGGRYLYCPRPDARGNTCLDFNRAYNPPCAFTDYATCLLPPAENHLPVAITAGEQATDHHE